MFQLDRVLRRRSSRWCGAKWSYDRPGHLLEVLPWLNFTPDTQQVQAERFSFLEILHAQPVSTHFQSFLVLNKVMARNISSTKTILAAVSLVFIQFFIKRKRFAFRSWSTGTCYSNLIVDKRRKERIAGKDHLHSEQIGTLSDQQRARGRERERNVFKLFWIFVVSVNVL